MGVAAALIVVMCVIIIAVGLMMVMVAAAIVGVDVSMIVCSGSGRASVRVHLDSRSTASTGEDLANLTDKQPGADGGDEGPADGFDPAFGGAHLHARLVENNEEDADEDDRRPRAPV